MSDRGDGSPAGESYFSSRLQALKERGCTVLVTGDAPGDAHVGICRRLLGDESKGRRRLLVFTNGTFALDDRLPAGGRGDDTEVIVASATRSAAVQQPAREDGVVELRDATLDELGVAVVEACQDLEARHGPFEPAELRFGLDSLSPLLDAHGEQPVFEFLTVLTRYVRAYDAMGHVHLPVDRRAEVARLLAPLFDAVVEVRVRDGREQHRWQLQDDALTSRWLPI